MLKKDHHLQIVDCKHYIKLYLDEFGKVCMLEICNILFLASLILQVNFVFFVLGFQRYKGFHNV